MFAYGVPFGGKRVLFDNEFSVMIPYGGVYTQRGENGQVGYFGVPVSRPIGYKDGYFRIDDDDLKANCAWINPIDMEASTDFAGRKKDILTKFKGNDSLKFLEVMYEDEEIYVLRGYIKITLGFQVEIRSSYDGTSQRGSDTQYDIYTYTGFVFTRKKGYMLRGCSTRDRNDTIEDNFLRSIRYRGHNEDKASVVKPVTTAARPAVTSAPTPAVKPVAPPKPEISREEQERRRREQAMNNARNTLKELISRYSDDAKKSLAEKRQAKHSEAMADALEQAMLIDDMELDNARQELKKQGLFAFGRKKELRQQIADVQKHKGYLTTLRDVLRRSATDRLRKAVYAMCTKPDTLMTIAEMAELTGDNDAIRMAGVVREHMDSGLVIRREENRKAVFKLAVYPKGVSAPAEDNRAELNQETLRLIVAKECLIVKGSVTEDAITNALCEKALKGRSTSSGSITMDNEREKQLILGAMDYSGKTVSEIMAADPRLGSLSSQRVASLVRQLYTEGKIDRYEEMRKAYFRLK